MKEIYWECHSRKSKRVVEHDPDNISEGTGRPLKDIEHRLRAQGNHVYHEGEGQDLWVFYLSKVEKDKAQSILNVEELKCMFRAKW